MRRRTLVAPETSHGAKPVMMAFEWNSGIASYMTSSGVKRRFSLSPVLIRARRRCDRMHAFGAPLVPDVNSSR